MLLAPYLQEGDCRLAGKRLNVAIPLEAFLARGCHENGSQICTTPPPLMPPWLTDARYHPSGDHASAFTRSFCACCANIVWPVSGSHTWITLSELAEARCRAGDQARCVTVCWCPR